MPVFPGFDGTSYHDGIDTMEGLADLTAELHGAAIGEPCDLVSQSFGGWVSLWLTVKHPGMVEKLVLECPAGFAIDGSSLPNDPQAMFRMLFAHPEKLGPPSKTPAQMEANSIALRRYPRSFVAEDLFPRLEEVRSPALILHGTLDRLAPRDGMLFLKSRLPQSHLYFVEDSAHVIHSDQPERYLGLVGAFLASGEDWLSRARVNGVVRG
jgi:pimeloyl-ACP methyl ester carboxylesterase